jgi:hypothetical protein
MTESNNASDPYQVRYVAFLDIIGFRNLIHTLQHRNAVLETRDLLRAIHEPPQFDELFDGSDLRAISISDAVAVSTAPTADGLAHMFANIELLTLKLLERGYFVRGAIVKGHLFHDDRQIFGEGLVRAYDFESKVARYPRVLLPNEVVEDTERYIRELKLTNVFDGQVRQSKDGPRFLHVLRIPYGLLGGSEGDEKQQRKRERLVKIKDFIQRRLIESLDEPRHFEKVQWFARYWNTVFHHEVGLSILGPDVA